MKDFLQKSYFPVCLALMLVLPAFHLVAQDLDIDFPEDVTLTCEDEIPEPWELILPGGECTFDNHEFCCDNQPVQESDGCFVALDECIQVALICFGVDDAGYPIYHFKVYNDCEMDLSNITFQLPQSQQVAILKSSGENNGDVEEWEYVGPNSRRLTYRSCDKDFRVELPKSGSDAGTIRFDGKLAPGKSACFTYKVLDKTPQEEIIVNPKVGTNDLIISILTGECEYGESLIKDFQVKEQQRGDICGDGLIIKRMYTIKFTTPHPTLTHTQTIKVLPDKEGPSGPCPEGKILSSYDHIPNSSEYIAFFESKWTDGCSEEVDAKLLSQHRVDEECGGYQIVQVYEIKDECGNANTCKIIHTAPGSGGNIVGNCPESQSDLECIDDVPNTAAIEDYIKDNFTGGDGGEVAVHISMEKSGNECYGFWVKYHITIRDQCGNERHCSVVYEGKDTTPPSGACPSGKENLHSFSEVPDPDTYIWYFKENWTDNCGGEVKARHVGTTKNGSECDGFEVRQKFAIKDQCGRTAFCEVVHWVKISHDELEGECPDGADDLQCINEVPDPDEVIDIVKESFDNEEEVHILHKGKDDNGCDGFTVKYKVKITGPCGEEKICWISYSGKDTTPPSGTCPGPVSDIEELSDVPDPGYYLWSIKEAYTDNCGENVYVKYVDTYFEDGDCGAFVKTYKYKVFDKCGNYVICKIKHESDGHDGDGLIGSCPEDVLDLQCIEEVPDASEVVWIFKEAFENEDMIRILNKYVDDDRCNGFTVKYKVKVTGECGESQICWLTFKGKDTTAPEGECPAGVSGLEDPDDAPDPSEVKAKIKAAFTDNCGGEIKVVFKGDSYEDMDDCGAFQVIQKFLIEDKCGNKTTCQVVHTGTHNGGEISGECPPSIDDFTCLSQVPTPEETEELVEASFTGSDGGEVHATLVSEEAETDNCAGFYVQYEFLITDACGKEETCMITYSGIDNVAPVFTTELSDLVIGCDETPTFDEIPEAKDNCGGPVTVKKMGEDMIIEGDCEASYSVIRSWVAEDECGNLSDPISQTITISGDCCEIEVCAYTPVYWGQNPGGDDTPNVREILEANGGTITVGPYELDSACIDVLLPGAPLATTENLSENCPEGLFSSSLVRHTVALTLNILNDPNLCEMPLSELPCPVDPLFYGMDESASVCDLLDAANEALEEEWFDCELADAIAAINECFDCAICVPDDGEEENEEDIAGEDSGSLLRGAETDGARYTGLSQLDMEVYPNPSSGLVNLTYAGFGKEKVWIFLHNAVGKLVHQLEVQEGNAAQVSLDLAGMKLTSGTYFITASNGEKTLSRKLLLSYQR